MRCDNCGEAVPRDAGACPGCGVYVRTLAKKKRGGTTMWILGLLLAAVAVGAFTYFKTRGAKPASVLAPPAPIRVVKDRPGGARKGEGATVSEPEAMRRLVRELNRKPDCVALMSHGYRDGAYDLTAVDRCDGTRLGRWRVDGKSGAVSRRHVG